MAPERAEIKPADVFAEALGDIGREFWGRGVAPHVDAMGRGYKTGFKYSITLSQLEEPSEVRLGPSDEILHLATADYHRLHIHISYTFHVPNPADSYSVGCVFNAEDLPQWFQSDDFFLRELVEIPELGGRDLSWTSIASEDAWDLAQNLFDVQVTLDGELIEPEDELLWDDRDVGIRWMYPLTEKHRELLRGGAEISVEAKTFQPITQRFFPAHITTPTRGVFIELKHGNTGIRRLHVERFFSSRKPYGQNMVRTHPTADGLAVALPSEDWALVGDGCVFIWDAPAERTGT